jgi:hypothetical protein
MLVFLIGNMDPAETLVVHRLSRSGKSGEASIHFTCYFPERENAN